MVAVSACRDCRDRSCRQRLVAVSLVVITLEDDTEYYYCEFFQVEILKVAIRYNKVVESVECKYLLESTINHQTILVRAFLKKLEGLMMQLTSSREYLNTEKFSASFRGKLPQIEDVTGNRPFRFSFCPVLDYFVRDADFIVSNNIFDC